MLTASNDASAHACPGLVRRVNFRRDVFVTANVTESAIIGGRFDVACHELRDFFSRNQVIYEWLDPMNPKDAAGLPAGAADAARDPVVIFANGRRLVAPTRRELAKALDLQIAALRRVATTWRSSAADRPDWQQPSMAVRRACARS